MTQGQLRKLLFINPNTNAQTTERLRKSLQSKVPKGFILEMRTATFGSHYIACEASHAVAAYASLQVWAQYLNTSHDPLDGVISGCFGDPGLFALREVSACRVTGLAEASFILAAQYGPFAIVTGGDRWKPMLERLAKSLGYGDLLRHIETVKPTGSELQADPDMAIRCLGEACLKAAEYGVQSVILGGAGLAGYAQSLRHLCDLPIIDSAEASLEVMLQGVSPPPQFSRNGFFANWSNMTPEIMKIPSR